MWEGDARRSSGSTLASCTVCRLSMAACWSAVDAACCGRGLVFGPRKQRDSCGGTRGPEFSTCEGLGLLKQEENEECSSWLRSSSSAACAQPTAQSLELLVTGSVSWRSHSRLLRLASSLGDRAQETECSTHGHAQHEEPEPWRRASWLIHNCWECSNRVRCSFSQRVGSFGRLMR